MSPWDLMETPLWMILLSGFFFTLVILSIAVIVVSLYLKYKMDKKFDWFIFVYVFALVGATSISIPSGVVTILNSICFMQGHTFQNMPLETLNVYMLYTIFAVLFLNALGLAGIFASLKRFPKDQKAN